MLSRLQDDVTSPCWALQSNLVFLYNCPYVRMSHVTQRFAILICCYNFNWSWPRIVCDRQNTERCSCRFKQATPDKNHVFETLLTVKCSPFLFLTRCLWLLIVFIAKALRAFGHWISLIGLFAFRGVQSASATDSCGSVSLTLDIKWPIWSIDLRDFGSNWQAPKLHIDRPVWEPRLTCGKINKPVHLHVFFIGSRRRNCGEVVSGRRRGILSLSSAIESVQCLCEQPEQHCC